jgi:hypothetical protein
MSTRCYEEMVSELLLQTPGSTSAQQIACCLSSLALISLCPHVQPKVARTDLTCLLRSNLYAAEHIIHVLRYPAEAIFLDLLVLGLKISIFKMPNFQRRLLGSDTSALHAAYTDRLPTCRELCRTKHSGVSRASNISQSHFNARLYSVLFYGITVLAGST